MTKIKNTKILLTVPLFFLARVAYAEVQSIISAESGGFITSIGNIYKYAQVLGVALAVFMIAAGGLYIAISGASPSKQQEGKDMIKSAIFGLILLFGAVLILNTINPKLTVLSLPGVKKEVNVGDSSLPNPSCPLDVYKSCSPSIEIFTGSLPEDVYLPDCLGPRSLLWWLTLGFRGGNCSHNILVQRFTTVFGAYKWIKEGDRYLRLPYHPKDGTHPQSKAKCIFVAYEHDGKVRDFGGRDGLLRCPPPSPFQNQLPDSDPLQYGPEIDALPEDISDSGPISETGLQSCTLTGCPHTAAVNYLQSARIGVSSSGRGLYPSSGGCTANPSPRDGCKTSLEGMPPVALRQLKDLKEQCPACNIVVTGGTDNGRGEHGSGNPVVDIDNNTALARFFIENKSTWGARVYYIRIPHVMLEPVVGPENFSADARALYTRVYEAYGTKADDDSCNPNTGSNCTPSHFHIVFKKDVAPPPRDNEDVIPPGLQQPGEAPRE